MKASIVIAAFNAEKTIAKCLQSLARQAFKDFEIIVVDDESSDNTTKEVKLFPNVRLVRQKHNGPAVARNRGARAAKGEIVVFTDSDCIPEKNWLQQMMLPFADRDIAGVQGTYKSRQPELVARLIQLEIEKRHQKMQRQRFIDFMGTYSAAYKKSVFIQMNGFDESFPIASGEDTDLSFRAHEAGCKMVFNPRAIVLHRHPTSLWKYLKVKFFRAFWRTKVYKRHKGKMVKDSYTNQMVKVQTLLFYLLLASALGAFFDSLASVLFVGFFLALLLTTIPFAIWAFSRDRAVGVSSPAISLLRTAAFGLGLAAGTGRELLGK